jgi:hypothetical protein
MVEEQLPGPSDIGSVMVEIGGDRGAAIVWTDEEMAGAEIEVRASGDEWDGTHVAVLERRTGDGVRFAALYSSLPAGPHEFRLRPPVTDEPALTIEVVGGTVAEASWPS